MTGGTHESSIGAGPAEAGNEVQDWIVCTKTIVDQIFVLLRQRSGSFLVLDPDRPYYIQFSWDAGEDELRCEAVSNLYLDDAHQLSVDQQAALRDMGWHPPGKGDAARSHNYARVFYGPANPVMLAALAGSTLRAIYGSDARRLRWRTAD